MVLLTTLADKTTLPTSNKLLFLLMYRASVRKTEREIRDEFETVDDSSKFCGRVKDAVEEATEEKLRLFLFNSKSGFENATACVELKLKVFSITIKPFQLLLCISVFLPNFIPVIF